jgi:hypothetical protein
MAWYLVKHRDKFTCHEVGKWKMEKWLLPQKVPQSQHLAGGSEEKQITVIIASL